MNSTQDKKEAAQEHYQRGLNHLQNNKTQKALESFEAAINADFSFHPAFAAAAGIFYEQRQLLQAADCYACAIQADPANIDYKKKFIRTISPFRFSERNDRLKAIVLECLKTPSLDHSELSGMWLSVVALDADFSKPFMAIEDYKFLSDEFFLEGLRRLIIYDLQFEHFLTDLRKALLSDAKLYPELTEALSRYCFYTEYIFDVTAHEFELLKGRPDMLACYEAPQAWQQKWDNIPSLTEIKDKVSQGVQAQYEVFPYPRWSGFETDIRNPEIEGYLKNKAAKILVAGCGTGKEAIELGAVFPDAEILAVDLSRTSLSYGMQKAREFGIKNVRFMHGDILDLGVLDQRFDYITSSGVLHHMEDPFKGWSVIAGLLKPQGLMRIALYSEMARRSIVEARNVIAAKHIQSDAEGIRSFRRHAKSLLNEKAYSNITHFRDYYSMSECRDLLFHVQEHRYSLPQIQSDLKKLGLEFLSFYLHRDVFTDFKKTFKDVRNLEQWAQFENKNPDTFIGMYRFWCRKI